MAEAIFRDGKIAEQGAARQGCFAYQCVRTLGYRAIMLDEHLALLDTASQELFDRPSAFADSAITAANIAMLLSHNGYSEQRSHIVALRTFADGSLEIECLETSLYDTLTLRALRPVATTIRAYDEAVQHPSSASLAATLLHREYARMHGAEVVVTIDIKGHLRYIDGAEAAVLIGGKIIFAPHATSPEYALLMRAAAELGRKTECRNIEAKELLRADEVLFIDHRGITALESLASRRYADIVTERLARHIEQLFR